MYKDYKPTKTILKVIIFYNDSLMLKFVKIILWEIWVWVEEKDTKVRNWKVKKMIRKILLLGQNFFRIKKLIVVIKVIKIKKNQKLVDILNETWEWTNLRRKIKVNKKVLLNVNKVPWLKCDHLTLALQTYQIFLNHFTTLYLSRKSN